MSNKFLYYVKKLKFPFALVSFILSVVGSIQVYHGQFDNLLKEFVVIIYSVIKLFTFFPTESVLKNSPLAYELATWMAPITTVLGLFTVFRNLYSDSIMAIRHLNKDRLIVLGANKESLIFIKNTLSQYPKKRIVCLVDFEEEVDSDILKLLQVQLVRIDYSNPEAEVNRLVVKDEKLYKGKKIVSFEKEPKVYYHVQVLSKLLEEYKDIDVYIRTETYRVKEIVEESMDKIKNFNINYFNINDLMTNNFLQEFNINNTNGLKASWKGKKFDTLEDIANQVSRSNILFIGYSNIVNHVLSSLSNISVTNPLKSTKVTIIDEDVYKKFDEFMDYKTRLKSVLDYELIEIRKKSRKIEDIFLEKSKEEAFNAIFFCDEDDYTNLINMDRIEKYIRNLSVAVYSAENSDIDTIYETMKSKIAGLKIFGNIENIINHDVIINETQLEKAKKFNAYYNLITAEMMGYEKSDKSLQQQWKSLSNIKKESSWNQSLHQNTKRLLLSKFSELDEFKDENILSLWKSKLENLTVDEQVDVIENDIYMNYMTSLEHKRWNNFYYMRDFVYDEIKDESNKKHDCLIDNWDDFMSSKQRPKAIYDFISTLALEEE
ncbi:hypothetical protein HIF96_02860 [Helcococcus kunzii]|uniref:RCK N-terminal domain-containing protein n=2 Tax=Helcococcus kunzii TaxID=40091 RepID=H3NMR0_9FIRM|nr:hypothetical protein [Helcococcus kunzii]EHR34651.1 hypothetical protein HMPREF9709_00621 [Helcococcus kunzii ATCC 51366]QUY64564.1 hypothetical protein GUI37_03200 [Helcococcus kunzii]QZO76977.1 hypothetical protein HIF96_02860 [Helcococcus kunzii]